LKVLLIDDSPEIASTVSFAFRIRWPETIILHAEDGSQGIEMVEAESPDIVIADINLPDIDGFEVLRQIRLFSDTPIIFLSVRGAETDRVRGLEIGADDYIVKPFSPLDLLARVQAILRRTGTRQLSENLPPFTAGNLTVDFSTRDVTLNRKSVHLTPREYKLLCHLIRNEGKVVTRSALKRMVWDEVDYLDASTIKKYIYQLRNKLNDSTGRPKMILNERGIGYKFVRPKD